MGTSFLASLAWNALVLGGHLLDIKGYAGTSLAALWLVVLRLFLGRRSHWVLAVHLDSLGHFDGSAGAVRSGA